MPLSLPLIALSDIQHFYLAGVVYELRNGGLCGKFAFFATVDDNCVFGAVFHVIIHGVVPHTPTVIIVHVQESVFLIHAHHGVQVACGGAIVVIDQIRFFTLPYVREIVI